MTMIRVKKQSTMFQRTHTRWDDKHYPCVSHFTIYTIIGTKTGSWWRLFQKQEEWLWNWNNWKVRSENFIHSTDCFILKQTSCPLKLQQAGSTEVSSTLQKVEGTTYIQAIYLSFFPFHIILGKWKNLFSCKTKVTNTGKENISVTEVKGYYKNNGR